MARQLIYIGAGRGEKIEQLTRHFQVSQADLIEGQAPLVDALATRLEKEAVIRCQQAWVSADGHDATFYHYNLPEFDGLLKASGLKELFPNLKLRGSETVATVAVTELVERLLAANSGNDHILVLDVPGQELALLQALATAKLHRRFGHVEVVTCQEQWFEGVSTSAETQAALQAIGFTSVPANLTDDPDFPVFAGERDAVAEENFELREQVTKLTAELADAQAMNAKLSDDLAAAEQQLAQEREKNEALRAENAAMQTQQSELMNSLTSKLDAVVEETTRKVVQGVSASVANTTKQLEAFISVQRFLDTGEASLDYHGWPISSDIALFLVNKVREENFDVIIEFGSGTSTVLFAKAIQQARARALKDTSDLKRIGDHDESRDLVEFRSHDLPKRVVTFEHNRKFYDKTLASLNTHGVAHLVDLVHAPLVDWQAEGKDYLHYDCDDKLQEIRNIFEGRQAKILVFVDGPPAATCEQARYPAIPKILQYLGRHELHIVMDDYVRDEEKRAAGRWSKLFETRNIPTVKQLLKFEKDGYLWVLNRPKS